MLGLRPESNYDSEIFSMLVCSNQEGIIAAEGHIILVQYLVCLVPNVFAFLADNPSSHVHVTKSLSTGVCPEYENVK